MAYATGTASDHLDLLDRLRTFLTTDSTLVGLNQQWESLYYGNAQPAVPYTRSRIAWGTTFSPTNTIIKDGPPSELGFNTSVKWRCKGTLNVASTQTFDFALDGMTSCQIVINGTVVAARYAVSAALNNWTTAVKGSITLGPGAHTFEVRTVSAATSGVSIGVGLLQGASYDFFPMALLSSVTQEYESFDGVAPTNAAEMTQMWTDKVLFLRGPGLSETDEVYVNLRTHSSVALDLYNIDINYAAGYNAALAYKQQPGLSFINKCMACWNQPMKYWFIANGRRFVVVAKVSTVYESMYGGLFLPLALPTEYPYPMFTGANFTARFTRWSVQDTTHGAFWNPPASNSGNNGAASIRRTDGYDEQFGNYGSTNNSPGQTYPCFAQLDFRTSPDGQYMLTPITLMSDGAVATAHGNNVYGELDGVYHVSGFSNSSESLITISGVDYLVVQSGFRTTAHDYAAIKLG